MTDSEEMTANRLSRRLFLGGAVAAAASGAVLPRFADAASAATPVADTASGTSGVAGGGAGVSLSVDPDVTHVAVRWQGDPHATVELAVRHGSSWGEWQAVPVWHDGAVDAQSTSGLVRVSDADAVAARVVGGSATDLLIVPIAAGDGPPALSHAAASDPNIGLQPATTTTTTAPAAAVPKVRVAQPPVISRSRWGADESLRVGTPEFAPLTKLIMHHTVTQNGDPDPASTVRAIYAYHTLGNGWNDIGYNFLIDEAGRIYEGRFARIYDISEIPTGEDLDGNGVIGAHALNANTGSVGVALLGTFTDQQPTPAAISALEAIFAWKADRHDIESAGSTPFAFGDGTTRIFSNISGHRDTYSTECPGDRAYVLLPAIRQAVDSRVSGAYGTTPGYWLATRDGQVLPFGQAPALGSMAGRRLNTPIASIAPTPSGKGYWLLGTDGGIFSFGDAHFYGSTGSMILNQPIVGLEPTPAGDGYWLVAHDGGIFAFGAAGFFGSTGGIKLNKPVVSMRSTPTGKGYWLVAADGGIFAYGDAVFHGSTGALKLNSGIVGMAAARDGYWLLAHDGGIFAFDVPFKGSVPGLKLPAYAGSVQMTPTASGRGYYVLGTDGGIFTFGDANYLGTKAGLGGSTAAAGMALYQPPTSV